MQADELSPNSILGNSVHLTREGCWVAAPLLLCDHSAYPSATHTSPPHIGCKSPKSIPTGMNMMNNIPLQRGKTLACRVAAPYSTSPTSKPNTPTATSQSRPTSPP